MNSDLSVRFHNDNVFVSFELTCHMVERIKAGNSKENLQREVESNTITRPTEATHTQILLYRYIPWVRFVSGSIKW